MGTRQWVTGLEPFLCVEKQGEVAVIAFSDQALGVAVDLERADRLWDLFDSLGSSQEVRVLLFISTPNCFSPERCDQFWQQVPGFGGDETDCPDRPEAWKKLWIFREEHAFQNAIKKIRSTRKVVVAALQGDVSLPFLGVALACDYRLAAENTVFHNRCHELGMPPPAGLPFLLPLYVGFGRASTILLGVSQFEAAAALEWGLVDRVVPEDLFEDDALQTAHGWAKRPPETVAAIKRLLNAHLANLSTAFENEDHEIERAMISRLGKTRSQLND